MSSADHTPVVVHFDRFTSSSYRSWMRLAVPSEHPAVDPLSAASISARLPWLWKLHLTGQRLVAEVPEELFAATEDELRRSIDAPEWSWPAIVNDPQALGELREMLGDWAGAAGAADVSLDLRADRRSYVRAGAQLVLGGVRLIVDVACLPPAGTHRQAAAALVCRVCDGLVMTRACIDGRWIRYDVSIPAAPTPTLLDRALQALSTGCRLAGRESYAALGDPVIAETFLQSCLHSRAACAAGSAS